MSMYLKLVNMEIQRFWKWLAVLVAITALSQITSLYLYLHDLSSRLFLGSNMTNEAYVDWVDMESFENAVNRNSLWFFAPIAIGIVVLLLYVFIIWYRDWIGKNTFAYRLLMLPTSRHNLYLAKLTAVLIFVLALLSVQILLFQIEKQMYFSMISFPPESLNGSGINTDIYNILIMVMLLPSSFSDFVLYYGIGIVGVIVVFTSILMERSFGKKGLLAGIVYFAACACIVTLPVRQLTGVLIAPYRYMATAGDAYLYPTEEFILAGVLALLVCGISLWIGFYLLRKKVTV